MENAAGNVSEEVTSCAKFFCLQAEGREPLKKEMLLELREGLAFLLQTMCKAGNALAIRCLLGIAAAGGRQQLMAMHSQSGNHPTGLHLAAIHGHKDVVETLLALAPEPMQLCLAVNSDGMAPLHCAARDGHEATARALLQRAPDGFSLLQMPQKSSSALRPLHWAAKQGHVEVVKCFLEFAPKPAVICVEADSAGNTALHFAAAGGHTVTCHALLTHAGPSNELSDRAILLLSAVNRFDRQTALHIAADRGEKEVVDTLLHGAPDRSALLGMSDKLGQTALHLSCERGHGAVVRKLLHSGDSHLVAARERITGQTALHMAAEAGHNEAVRAILEASPLRETSLATDRGARNTALHLAAERGPHSEDAPTTQGVHLHAETEEPIVLMWMWLAMIMNGAVLTVVVVAVYLISLGRKFKGANMPRQSQTPVTQLSKAQTVAFISLVWSENIRAYISRSFTNPMWHDILGNKHMQKAIVMAQICLYVAVLTPYLSDRILGLRGLEIGASAGFNNSAIMVGPVGCFILSESCKIISAYQAKKHQDLACRGKMQRWELQCNLPGEGGSNAAWEGCFESTFAFHDGITHALGQEAALSAPQLHSLLA
eukprot:s1159_g4.t1